MSDDGGVHDRFGCQPITLDDSYVCVWNGKDKEPCALQVHNVKGTKIVRVKKSCHEWCRLLTSKPAYKRPFRNLEIWNEWKVAIGERFESMTTKKNTHERLEAVENDGKASSRQDFKKKRKFEKDHPVLQVTMPKEPDSDETIDVTVESNPGNWGFELNERNIQWLRTYILKELEKKQKD